MSTGEKRLYFVMSREGTFDGTGDPVLDPTRPSPP